MRDRRQHDYAELLTIQDDHLKLWSTRLVPETWLGVRAFARLHNRPAATPEDPHHVIRGQDLIQLIMEWPHPNEAYFPPVAQPRDAREDV